MVEEMPLDEYCNQYKNKESYLLKKSKTPLTIFTYQTKGTPTFVKGNQMVKHSLLLTMNIQS